MQRYEAIHKNDDDSLRLALVRLAKQYGRYGYRKITQLLRMEGWVVNHKKIERLWREEGLQLPHCHQYLAQTVQSRSASSVVKHETASARDPMTPWYITRGLYRWLKQMCE
jgi:transposase InsO family protein